MTICNNINPYSSTYDERRMIALQKVYEEELISIKQGVIRQVQRVVALPLVFQNMIKKAQFSMLIYQNTFSTSTYQDVDTY